MLKRYIIPLFCGACFLFCFGVEAAKTYQLEIDLSEERTIVVQKEGNIRIITKNSLPVVIVGEDFEISKNRFNLEGFSFNPSSPLPELYKQLKTYNSECKTCVAYSKYVQSIRLRTFEKGIEKSVKSMFLEKGRKKRMKIFRLCGE